MLNRKTAFVQIVTEFSNPNTFYHLVVVLGWDKMMIVIDRYVEHFTINMNFDVIKR